jgi:plasmid maintenance system antidote protein VapI
MMTIAPAPADLRAELARLGLPHYIVAARVGIHPSRFSRFLWGRERMSAGLAKRLLQVIAEERKAREQIAE